MNIRSNSSFHAQFSSVIPVMVFQLKLELQLLVL